MLQELGIGAANAAMNIGNGFIQEYFNKRQEKRNLGYYNMQRQDALDDWNMNNAYNSPQAQVDRMKAAGFNPHLLQGQSQVASQPQQRPQMQGASGYTVNNATSALQIRQGVEQLRAQQIANEKGQVDVEIARQDLKSRTTDNNTLADRRNAELAQQLSNLNLSNLSYQEKQQGIENAKATLQGILVDTRLKAIRELYENDLLAGNKVQQAQQLQNMQAQYRQIEAQIRSIDTRTNQDVQSFANRMRLLQQQIESVSAGTANTKANTVGKSIENYYSPVRHAQQQSQQEVDLELSREQLQYLRTLDPRMRYILDKTGAGDIINSLIKARK